MFILLTIAGIVGWIHIFLPKINTSHDVGENEEVDWFVINFVGCKRDAMARYEPTGIFY